MKFITAVLSLVLLPVITAFGQTSVLLEGGIPIAVSESENASLSDGYAIVASPDGSATGVIYRNDENTGWAEQGAVSVPDCIEPGAVYAVQRRGVLAISDKVILIGVNCDQSSSGRAYIFRQTDNGQWVQDAVLDGHARPWDFFGKAVAISGDTVAVGSNPGGEAGQEGRVALYSRSDEGWNLQQNIDSIPGDPDSFGDSIQLSDDFLVIPHRRRGEDKADIYHNSNAGWLLHSVINGGRFALDGNTLVVAEPGVLRTYTLDVANSQSETSTIEYPDETIQSIAIDGECLVVALNNTAALYHYRKTDENNWQYESEIDAMPSVPVELSRFYLTINGISDRSVMITRAAYYENSAPLKDTHIVDLGELSGEQSISNDGLDETLLQENMDSSIEENNGLSGSGKFDWTLIYLMLLIGLLRVDSKRVHLNGRSCRR